MKEDFLKYFNESFEQFNFVKLTLGKYRGKEDGLEKIYVEPIKVGGDVLLSFRYKYKTKDVFENYGNDSVTERLFELLGKDFLYGALYTTKNDIIIEFNKKRESKIYKNNPTFANVVIKSHNRTKSRFISNRERFLHLLGITNSSGEIRSSGYDKFRQIDKFIQVVDSLYRESSLGEKRRIDITDFGSGKSYLTFALYYYFKMNLGVNVNIIGVEQRADMVELSNKCAKACGYNDLKFLNNNILNYAPKSIDIVVALHACDTATDDVIALALKAKAEIIILAPCCQKYVRGQISIPKNLKSIFSHGIFEEHISSFVTDGLRALMLEANGYDTKVFEFISREHTAKNIMITAVRNYTAKALDKMKLNDIEGILSEFGMKDFYLDKLLDLHYN